VCAWTVDTVRLILTPARRRFDVLRIAHLRQMCLPFNRDCRNTDYSR